MHAVIMAGGAGTRLLLGEKPMVTIAGRPMISYVLSAFEKSGYDPIIVASFRTPFTMNWARANGFEYIQTEGHGYIHDLLEAAKSIEISGPFFSCVADLPCLSTGHINKIRLAYEASGKEALSTWVPLPSGKEKSGTSYYECIQGVDACPVGINILIGDIIDRPQEEEKFILDDPHLAYNINTRADLEKVRELFSRLPPREEDFPSVLPE